jgi:hypothetical protein
MGDAGLLLLELGRFESLEEYEPFSFGSPSEPCLVVGPKIPCRVALVIPFESLEALELVYCPVFGGSLCGSCAPIFRGFQEPWLPYYIWYMLLRMPFVPLSFRAAVYYRSDHVEDWFRHGSNMFGALL